ncbi:hypothetical protein BJ165DRAFT_13310 [Panaeolus papilionaceus]|nr:hypothetical protein BJ165DRAFT_13310 [Panaeolus papilionaceus]
MELPQLSLDNFVALALIIGTPWLYKVFRPFSEDKPSTSKVERAISIGLLLHTIAMLYNLFVSPPTNIFKALGVHSSAPPEVLKAKLAESLGGVENIPAQLEILLKRLGLIDMRSLYIRFGHDVLSSCAYCHSFEDFALYALPGPLVQYIREIAFVGMLTLPKSDAEHFRPLGLGALLAALLTEFYWTLTVPAPIATNANMVTTMWHDYFVQLRYTLFLVVPLVVYSAPYLGLHNIPIIGAFMPGPPPPVNINIPGPQYKLQGQESMIPPKATLNQVTNMTMQTLGHLVPTLQLLKYTHAAIMRDQGDGEDSSKTSMHDKASQWWADEKREGDAVRKDENIAGMFKGAGMGFEPEVKDGEGAVVQPEGKLLLSARMAIDMMLQQGVKPSDHWIIN